MESTPASVPCDSLFRPVASPCRSPVLLIILAGLLCLLTGECTAIQPKAKAKNVLILWSSIEGDPRFVDVVEPAIRKAVPEPVTFYTSYLVNQPAARDRLYQESQAETFRRIYAGVKLDLVIAVAPQALLFAVNYRDRIFPDVPIVFTQVGTREFQGRTWPGVTGLTIPVGIGETIDLALRLHPDTTTVALIQGRDWFWIEAARSELLRYQNKVKLIVFSDDPDTALLAKVRSLPAHTLVLFHLPLPRDTTSEFGTRDLLAGVAERWPTYSAWRTNCLNFDCIGGAYPDVTKEHLATAQIAARVLSGEQPENIPITQDSSLQVEVDWRQLQRWHVPESALPAGSVVLFRQPTLWQRYRNYVIAAAFVIVAQALLIAALLWQRARKRKAESVLRESEERFRLLANATPTLIWMCDLQGKTTYLNDRRFAYTGSDPHAGYGDTWVQFVHPDDVHFVLDRLSNALKTQKSFSKEYRLRRTDGTYRWIFNIATPRFTSDGSFAGFIGSIIDITDQKLARETLQKLSGHLIEAQEKERTRIARELHDDICQRLALLSVELGQAARGAHGASRRLEEIRQHCSDIAGDVQALSHRLHSSKLDYLGIVAALKGFCEEFSRQHEVTIAFKDENVPRNVPHDASLCLFRIAQEALRNALKYSQTRTFEVELTGTANEVRLEVRDRGTGFDVNSAKFQRGLGLVSMQERVNLMRGRFSIESTPGEGTKVVAIVPLPPDSGASPITSTPAGEMIQVASETRT